MTDPRPTVWRLPDELVPLHSSARAGDTAAIVGLRGLVHLGNLMVADDRSRLMHCLLCDHVFGGHKRPAGIVALADEDTGIGRVGGLCGNHANASRDDLDAAFAIGTKRQVIAVRRARQRYDAAAD